MKILLVILVVIALAFGGKKYYKDVQAEKQAKEAAAQAEKVARDAADKKRQEEQLLANRKTQIEQRAKDAVRVVLKDPESAQFKIIKIGIDIPNAQNEGQIFDSACGEVNSKNSFGGYIGFKRFMWYSLEKMPMFEPSAENDNESFNAVWNKACS